MSEITQDRLDRIVETADEILSALAGKNEDVHPDDSKKMCQLWDELNDSLAPPEVVKAIVLELSELRKERERAEPVYQERRFHVSGKKQIEYWAEINKGAYQYLPESERRIVYAAPPAQPVAVPIVYIGKQMLESLCDEGGRSCGRVWRSNTDEISGESRIPLYAAQHPVAVPDVEFDEWAKNVGLISESHGVRSVNSVTDIARKAWNACRAAMLAAPGKEG